jgi:biopolymer transport protein TolQ
MGGVSATGRGLDPYQVGAVRNAAERTLAAQVLLLENSITFLATAASTAPFLGLLGTVWGVMDAFAGMAVTGKPMLSEVAPGISGALLTTVVGLLVALPSSMGYNMLGDRVRRLSVEMDNFAQEFLSDVERHFQQPT